MFQGTTPTIILTFGEDVDFSEAESVVVTFATDYHKVVAEFKDEELTIDGNVISRKLTQAETLAMPNTVLVQVNVLYPDGTRAASNIVSFSLDENLKDEVML